MLVFFVHNFIRLLRFIYDYHLDLLLKSVLSFLNYVSYIVLFLISYEYNTLASNYNMPERRYKDV